LYCIQILSGSKIGLVGVTAEFVVYYNGKWGVYARTSMLA